MQQSKKKNKRKCAGTYYTNRKSDKEIRRDVFTEVSPYERLPLAKILAYKEYSDVKGKEARLEMVRKPVHDKDNYRTRMMRDVNERLYISQLPDEVRTVADFYPEFYTAIEGRPLRTSDEIKVYMNNVRRIAMIRQQVGYRRDMILQLGQNLVDEKRRYNAIHGEYKQHVSNFKQFIEDDHKVSVEKVHTAELVRTALNAKMLKCFPLVTRLNVLYGRILELEDIRNTFKKYRQFLFQVSPLSWRNIYDQRYKKTKILFELDQNTFTYQAAINIDNVAVRALEELKNRKHLAHLYFKQPIELMTHFEHIELQCKKYILHIISLASTVYQIESLKSDYIKIIKTEEGNLHEFINVINEKIVFMEECTTTKRNLFLIILDKVFFKTIASERYLKFRVCIEYVFQEIFGKMELAWDSLIVPMKMIELTYEEINLKLDFMDLKIVNIAQKDCYLDDLKVMHAAFQASRKLKEFRELKVSLQKAFSPPARYQRRRVGKFVKKKPKAKKKLVEGIDSLTETQRENLELFTTWCAIDDPVPYLTQLKRQSFNFANG